MNSGAAAVMPRRRNCARMADFESWSPTWARMTSLLRRLPLLFIALVAGAIFFGAPAALIEAQSGIRGFSAAHAEENLKHITSEPHMAGTEGSHQLAEWLRQQYESFGFDAKIVTYSVWLP